MSRCVGGIEHEVFGCTQRGMVGRRRRGEALDAPWESGAPASHTRASDQSACCAAGIPCISEPQCHKDVAFAHELHLCIFIQCSAVAGERLPTSTRRMMRRSLSIAIVCMISAFVIHVHSRQGAVVQRRFESGPRALRQSGEPLNRIESSVKVSGRCRGGTRCGVMSEAHG